MRSEWSVGRFSNLEAIEVLTKKPTPEWCPSVVGFPDQKKVYPTPCSWRQPSHRKRTSLRAAMSTFNQNISGAIRAEWRSGRLLWATWSMVLTLQHATFRIFALLEVGAYLPCFNVLGPFVKMFIDRQLENERRASVRSPFLGLSLCRASGAVPKEGFLVVQGAAGWCCRLRSTSDDQYLETSAFRIGAAAL